MSEYDKWKLQSPWDLETEPEAGPCGKCRHFDVENMCPCGCGYAQCLLDGGMTHESDSNSCFDAA